MRIVVTGAAGFIGSRLAAKLLELGKLRLDGATDAPIEQVTLVDVIEPENVPDDPRANVVVGDLSDEAQVRELIGENVDAVFHLAAVVSGAAEENFELGYRVNLDGTRNILEAGRRNGGKPRLVFAGSSAEYGGNLPDLVPDTFYLNPQNSYGVQKACSELLVKDYSRKGFIDGRVPRLPTIIVRPGKPNKAASSFASSIIREPLTGYDAVCPASAEAGIYVLSPQRVIDSFIHAMELPANRLGVDRAFMLPGVRTTVGELVNALGRVAGEKYVRRISWEKDERIESIVAGWPAEFEASQAKDLGFKADNSVDDIVQQFIDDELGGKLSS